MPKSNAIVVVPSILRAQRATIDQYWDRYNDAYQGGDTHAMTTLIREIRGFRFSDLNEECERRILLGDCLTVVARLVGNERHLRLGLYLIGRCVQYDTSLKPATSAHLYLRLGNARLRLGFLIRKPRVIRHALENLTEAHKRLFQIYFESKNFRILQSISKCYRDMGEGQLGLLYWDKTSILNGKSVDLLALSLAKNSDDATTRSAYALSLVMQVVYFKNRKVTIESGYEVDQEKGLEEAKAIIEELWNRINEKPEEFSHARAYGYIGIAAGQMFIATRSSKWISLAEASCSRARKIYADRGFFFRQGLMDIELGQLLTRKANTLPETDRETAILEAEGHLRRAEQSFLKCGNSRAELCAKWIAGLEKHEPDCLLNYVDQETVEDLMHKTELDAGTESMGEQDNIISIHDVWTYGDKRVPDRNKNLPDLGEDYRRTTGANTPVEAVLDNAKRLRNRLAREADDLDKRGIKHALEAAQKHTPRGAAAEDFRDEINACLDRQSLRVKLVGENKLARLGVSKNGALFFRLAQSGGSPGFKKSKIEAIVPVPSNYPAKGLDTADPSDSPSIAS